ncbi:hypothetical protein CLIB1423_05S00826 [[Candida] railenensis]|uniref:Uncharacterized protein n=1 Tax=[Candida] railenensis TaxID=45579 RepID=A0A9P0QNV0_9ASCO|nr:hypothetical protein CLIB1423_05S00826 [[Candida] railenensis]
MDWESFLNDLPLELIEYIFTFFSIENDLKTLINLVSAESKVKEFRIRQVILNRLLKFVVIDPSCWVKEFSSQDYWYPSMKELKLLLSEIDVPITTNIQLCVHHNFEKNRDEIEELAQFLGSGRYFNIKCRLYMKDNFEHICSCVTILRDYDVFHKVTHLELVSTTTDIANLPEQGSHTGDKELATSLFEPFQLDSGTGPAKVLEMGKFPVVNY